jgi:predicted MPP superfamily phosphohydrolase
MRRRPLYFASAVCGYIAVTDLILAALHARGFAQAVLSYCSGLSALVQLPGFMAVQMAGLRHGHHTTLGVWVVLVIINFAFYFVAASVVLRALSGWRVSPATVPADNGPRRMTRRQIVAAGAGALAAGVLGYSMVVEPRRFEVTRRVVALRGLPPSLSGLRIVQLTDLHHGPWIELSYIERVVETTNALKPDVVLLTGDYVHRSPAYIEPVVAALAKLTPAIGTIAVLGNHDWWEDGPRTRRAFERAGIPLIDNARRFVTPDHRLTTHADEGLCIAGVGDYYEDEQRYDFALGGIPDAMPRLLLSHNPDVAEDVALRDSGHRVDLMISGHTHGGQIYVPGLGTPIVPSRYGEKYARGLVQGPVCPVFVCRGIGLTVLPVRVATRPELAVLELRGG